METTRRSFSISTTDRFEIRNVTAGVEDALAELSASDGLVYVSTPHTSAALSTNEFEEKLVDDMLDTLADLVPPNDGYYHDLDHVRAGEEPNAHAHILSAMIDRSVFAVLQDGRMQLGTWEEILFYEFCGPRDRTIEVTLLE